MDLREEIRRTQGQELADVEPLSGGCIGQVYLLHLADGHRLVAKIDDGAAPKLHIEGEMLAYLAAHSSLPVPAVHSSSKRLLIMSYLPGASRFSPGAQRHAAELLATLHGISAPSFGFAQDTLIGGLPQPNPWTASWLDFFRQQRLLYMAKEAVQAGRLPRSLFDRLAKLGERLERWLAEPERPSLIHGDVWTTNVLARGDQITGFLDPAVYFADPEIELAFITLFGTFGAPFFERYQQLRPIAPGFFEQRRDLYNLYPLLVHVRLFGGGYVASVEQIVRRFGC